MRALRLACGIIGLVSVALAPPVDAQVLRGRVVDSVSQAPLKAGFVVLVDAAGVHVDRALTTSTGLFQLKAPTPGLYRLRSERIGYRLSVSPPIEVPAGGTVSYTFQIVPIPLVLSAVEVRGERECALNPDQAQGTLLVWEEIQKALAATAWDGTQELAQYRKYNYERDLVGDRRRVTREAGQVVEGVASQPYESLPAAWLAREGYVARVGEDELQYALPDANVLLDDAFLSTHCFHVVRDARNRPGHVGLAFVPVAGHEVPDVRGALWLDETTAELRALEVSYTRLPSGIDDDRAGGTVEFLRLPSGAWIVQRWELRTPMIELRRRSVGLRDRGRPPEPTVVGWRDFGGEVLEVETADGGTVHPANVSHVRGTVYDSTRGGPLAGATVALTGTGFASVTDSAGAFHIPVPLEGVYAFTLSHVWLDSIAYRLDRSVELARGSTQAVALAIPHARSWLRELCPDGADTVETGAVVGIVRGSDGAPVAGATLTASWQVLTARGRTYVGVDWEGTTRTDAGGRYLLCRMPTGRAIAIRADRGGLVSRTADLILPTSQGRELLFAWDRRPGQAYRVFRDRRHPFWTVELRLAKQEAGPAPADNDGRLAGVVTDATTGLGLEGVRVVLNGRDSAVTRSDGTFDIAGLEFVNGTNIVALRRLGYRPRVRGFTLAEGQRALDLSMTLDPAAYLLEPIEVTAQAVDRYLDEVGFSDRKKVNNGYFLDRADVEALLGRVSDVIEMVATLPAISFRQMSSIEESCRAKGPLVFIDGFRFESFNFRSAVTPNDVYAVEVYRTPSQVPPQFAGAESGCGVILFWTWRGR